MGVVLVGVQIDFVRSIGYSKQFRFIWVYILKTNYMIKKTKRKDSNSVKTFNKQTYKNKETG